MTDRNDVTRSGRGKPPFRLDKSHGKLMGVCAGIGNYFGVDTTMVRLAFVAAALLGIGAPILIYLAIGLIAD